MMVTIKILLMAAAAINAVNAASIPTVFNDRSTAGFLHMETKLDPPPIWNFANSTTDGARADGSVGVIIEPDLVEGAPGKDGGIVKKIKFGKYTLKPGQKKEFPIGLFGLSPIERGLDTPCQDCYLTAMQLNLEYPDGTIANVDTGAWLHHVDISVTGTDYTCPSSLTSFIQHGGDAAMAGNRIYAGGNERVAVRLNSKEKFGIDPNRSPIKFGKTVISKPTMGGSVEIMSESVKALELYVTMLFEYVPKSTPGYRDANLVWVDVTNCAKESDFKPGQGVYQRVSKGFTMKEDGKFVFATGHMHDGGVRVELLVNGKVSCNSKQIYANRRGHYIEPTDGTIIEGLAMPPGSHISDVGVCKDWGAVKKGDVLSVKAYYDENQHMQMKRASGALEAQMGIMWTYIGIA